MLIVGPVKVVALVINQKESLICFKMYPDNSEKTELLVCHWSVKFVPLYGDASR